MRGTVTTESKPSKAEDWVWTVPNRGIYDIMFECPSIDLRIVDQLELSTIIRHGWKREGLTYVARAQLVDKSGRPRMNLEARYSFARFWWYWLTNRMKLRMAARFV